MSKDNTNSIQDNTSKNRENLNDSEILEIRGFKHGDKFGKLKDDNNYIFGNEGDNFKDKLLKNVLENENKDNKHNDKVLILKNNEKKRRINFYLFIKDK